MLGAAVFTPWRAWSAILTERREAKWFYVAVGLDSLLMRPDESIRAVWAIGRRGTTAIMPLLRLASLQIIMVLIGAAAFALFMRLIRRHSAISFAEMSGLAPWAYAPKFLVTLVFAALWLARTPMPELIFHCLSGAVIAGSLASLLRTHDHPAMAQTTMAQTPQRPGASLALAVVTALLIAGFAVRASSEPERFRPVGPGDAISTLQFDTLSITFPREQPVLIDFWASWCGPCVDALPDWQKLHSDKVTLVSANVENDRPYVEQFLHKNNYTFPVVMASAAVQGRFQVELLPSLVLLSSSGEIIAYKTGPTDVRALLDSITTQR